MSDHEPRFIQNVAEMRRAFDQVFAAPALPPADDREAFLAIRVAGRPFVLRVAELRRLEPSRKIVSLPGGTATLLGLAGIQGRLTPVYSLAEILELGASIGESCWIAVCGQEPELLGLSFEEFERYLQVPRTALVLGAAEAGLALPQAVREAETVRPILHLPAILAQIRQRVGVSS